MAIRFGTLNINSAETADERHIIEASYRSDPSIEQQKIFIGGIPLSLSRVGNFYSLFVIVENEYEDLGAETVHEGWKLAVYEDGSGNRVLPITEESSDEDADNHTMIYGMPLAINVDGNLILSQWTAEPDEYTELIFGNLTLRAGRVNENWFLIVCDS